MTAVRCYRAFLVFVAVLPLGGCLFRSRIVDRPISTAPLKSATQEQLIEYVNTQASLIHSMQATVDIDTSVGGEKKGKITDYEEIRGYVLARKPAMLRMIGLMPIVRTTAFDMVSDGQDFKLWIPPKNRFVLGRNDIESVNPKQPLENLRPQHIYDSLLLREINPDPQIEIATMTSRQETVVDKHGRKMDQPDYELVVAHKGANGWFTSRVIVFSRTDLLPHRQYVYDEKGNEATTSRYEAYKAYNGVNFPNQIEIERPQEEYDITLTIVKLQLNEALTDDQFLLEQPHGAEVIHLDRLDQPAANRERGYGGTR
jgi:outer membrane lipoprotein-sorting protein